MSEKVVSIFTPKEAKLRQKAERVNMEDALKIMFDDFSNKLQNMILPARRQTRRVVYAANHAAEWQAQGAELQALREASGVTRSALAKSLGVSGARIARLERGEPVRDARLLRAAIILFLERKGGELIN